MYKRVFFILIVLFITGVVISGCSSPQSEQKQDSSSTQTLNYNFAGQSTSAVGKSSEKLNADQSIEYIDGIYEGESNLTPESFYGKAKVTIKDGQIVDAVFEIYDNARQRVLDDSYGKEVYADSPTYQEQTKNDLAGIIKYQSGLISEQDVNKVDAISGATWSYTIFKEALTNTLKKAEKQ